MATVSTLTKAQLADRVLEHLGAKAAGQSSSAEDKVAAEEAVQSAWARLQYEGKAPFEIDFVPEWAWIPLRNYAARDLVDTFGIAGERLQSVLAAAARADRDFSVQTAGKHNPAVVTAPYWY